MNGRLLLVVSSLVLFASATWSADLKEEMKAMEGTWLPVEAELAGQKLPPEGLKSMKLILKGDTYTVHVADKIDQGTFKLDLGKKPKAMDIVGTEGPNKGKTILAIYELAGDSLKVCYALDGPTRPAEFKAGEGTKLFLVSYKRQKP